MLDTFVPGGGDGGGYWRRRETSDGANPCFTMGRLEEDVRERLEAT